MFMLVAVLYFYNSFRSILGPEPLVYYVKNRLGVKEKLEMSKMKTRWQLNTCMDQNHLQVTQVRHNDAFNKKNTIV